MRSFRHKLLELGRGRKATLAGHFQGDEPIQLSVSRQTDDAECAAAQRALNRISAKTTGQHFVACSAMNEINTRQARLQLVRDQWMGCQERGSVGVFPCCRSSR